MIRFLLEKSVYKEIRKKGEAPKNTKYIYQSTNAIK